MSEKLRLIKTPEKIMKDSIESFADEYGYRVTYTSNVDTEGTIHANVLKEDSTGNPTGMDEIQYQVFIDKFKLLHSEIEFKHEIVENDDVFSLFIYFETT